MNIADYNMILICIQYIQGSESLIWYDYKLLWWNHSIITQTALAMSDCCSTYSGPEGQGGHDIDVGCKVIQFSFNLRHSDHNFKQKDMAEEFSRLCGFPWPRRSCFFRWPSPGRLPDRGRLIAVRSPLSGRQVTDHGAGPPKGDPSTKHDRHTLPVTFILPPRS